MLINKDFEGDNMPTRPLKICKHPGCGRIAEPNGYCKNHQNAGWHRDKSRQAMYNHQWGKASKAYLAMHPWCTECMKQGIYTPAEVVDHIKPHKGNATLFWDVTNWQGLCKHHHDVKTAKETDGFGDFK